MTLTLTLTLTLTPNPNPNPNPNHLQMLTYGLGCGMSGCYWRNQHNKHHTTPQKLGADPDLATLPLVPFHPI